MEPETFEPWTVYYGKCPYARKNKYVIVTKDLGLRFRGLHIRSELNEWTKSSPERVAFHPVLDVWDHLFLDVTSYVDLPNPREFAKHGPGWSWKGTVTDKIRAVTYHLFVERFGEVQASEWFDRTP